MVLVIPSYYAQLLVTSKSIGGDWQLANHFNAPVSTLMFRALAPTARRATLSAPPSLNPSPRTVAFPRPSLHETLSADRADAMQSRRVNDRFRPGYAVLSTRK